MNIEQVMDILARMAQQANQSISQRMSVEDLNNPDALVKIQFAVQQYSNFISMESSLIKVIRDMISGIISKI